LPSEIDEIREELSDTGYIKKKNKDKNKRKVYPNLYIIYLQTILISMLEKIMCKMITLQ